MKLVGNGAHNQENSGLCSNFFYFILLPKNCWERKLGLVVVDLEFQFMGWKIKRILREKKKTIQKVILTTSNLNLSFNLK